MRLRLAVGFVLLTVGSPPPSVAQHVICCNQLVDVGGNWVGAWRSCSLGSAPPEQLPGLCQQLAGCSSAAAYCGVPDPCTVGGSIVDVANQALGESILVAGTPFRLGYRSDRAGDPYANDLAGWSLDVHHAYDVQGRLFYDGDGRRRVAWMPAPAKGAKEATVPSEDGRWVHSFVIESGRHIRTVDAVTGALSYRFGYDKAGKLASVEDAYANITRLERDAKGAPAAIVAPGGERTTLVLDAAGLLAAVTGPGGEKTALAYDRGGRLTTLTDPRGHVHRYTYTPAGTLLKDENPAGGGWTLAQARVGKASKVTLTSAGGRTAMHTVERSEKGDERREHRRSDGAVARMERATDGTRRTVYPDGVVQTIVAQPDPRFPNATIPRTVSYSTPGGRKLQVTFERTADGGHPGGDATEKVTVNGATYTSRFDSERGEWTWTSPAGRTLAVAFDDQGRVTSARPGGGAARRFVYDESGRVTTVTAGAGAEARTIGATWGERAVVLQDALRRSVRAELDSSGRLIREVAPDGRETRYVRNPEGLVEQIVPPDGRAHRFEYSPADLVTAYLPSDGPGERYGYDRDGLLTSTTVGNVKALSVEYDGAGRRSVVTTPQSTRRYQYDAASGHLKAVSTADGAVAYERDGPLVTAISWTGPVRGRVRRGYDDGLRLASVAVDGASGYAIAYDPDGLVVRAGDLIVERDGATGAVASTTLGVVTTRHVRNVFGELTRIEAAASGRPLLTLAYERDAGGRIVGRTETTPGGRREFRYAYDAAGRLAEVQLDGSRAASYAYDAAGDRVGAPAHVWRLDHDALGALRKGTASDGRSVEYLLDGPGRRIGRKASGRVVEGFLYLDALRPVARVDAAGSVTALFVHATRANVPDAMIANGATYRLVADHLGSPRLVVDAATGKVVQEIDYDAFGVVTRDSQPGFQPFGFAGGLYDPEAKLVHLGARDYDPAAGRWTSRDPLGVAGGTINLTEYVGSDPVNRIDPWGLQEDDPEWHGPVMDPGHPSVVIGSGGDIVLTDPDFTPGRAIDRPVIEGPSFGPNRADRVIDKFRNGFPVPGGGTAKGGSLDRDRFDRGDTPGLCTDTWTGQTGGQNRYTPEPEGAKGLKLDWRF